MLSLEQIKKKLLPLTLSLIMTSTFIVNAQGSIFIKNPDKVVEVKNEDIHIKSSSKTDTTSVDKVHITNGSDIVGGGSSSGGDSSTEENKPENTTNVIAKGVVTPVEGLNVRSGPSTSYSILGTLKQKETVDIYETTSGWHKIKYGTGFGYVSALYVTIAGDSSNTGDTTPSKPTTIKKVVIDPGHGGSDPGAIGPSGLREKDIVLDISLKLKDILSSKGYSIVMTRTTDVYLTLAERASISNNSGADLFLSIHNNSFSEPSANGTETFSYQSTGFGADVARKIQSELVSAHGLTNRGFKTENFHVLKYNKIPAALTEIAFISNPYEESLLANNAFRQKSAQAIADAIASFK